jgi:hypothetical protein
VRLTQIAEHYWFEIDGEAALAGVDLTRLPFRRYLAAVMSWANPRGARKEDELEQYNEWLFSPFEGTDPDKVTPEVVESEMAAFRAFAQQAGGAG